MNVDNCIKRLETALHQHDTPLLQSIVSDLGSELARQRPVVVRQFLDTMMPVLKRRGANLTNDEHAIINTFCNLARSWTAAVERDFNELADVHYAITKNFYPLLVCIKNSGRPITAADVAKQVKGDPESITKRLNQLGHTCFLDPLPRLKFALSLAGERLLEELTRWEELRSRPLSNLLAELVERKLLHRLLKKE